jgi:hypothetical protein
MQMDCIVIMFGDKIKINKSKAKLLTQHKFIKTYDNIKFSSSIGRFELAFIERFKLIYLIYFIIGFPIISTFIYILIQNLDINIIQKPWFGIPYYTFVILFPIICIIVHCLFVRNQRDLEKRIKSILGNK